MHLARRGTEENSSNRQAANPGGTIEYFHGSVFREPMFVEAHKVAALSESNTL
jgi:hypothetical protein